MLRMMILLGVLLPGLGCSLSIGAGRGNDSLQARRKSLSIAEVRALVKEAEGRGIDVDYDVLESGRIYTGLGRNYRELETVWKSVGDKALTYGQGKGGRVTCVGKELTDADFDLLSKLPWLSGLEFKNCTILLSDPGVAARLPIAFEMVRGVILKNTEPTKSFLQTFSEGKDQRVDLYLQLDEVSREHLGPVLNSSKYMRLTVRTPSLTADAFADFSDETTLKHVTVAAPNFTSQHREQLQNGDTLDSLTVK